MAWDRDLLAPERDSGAHTRAYVDQTMRFVTTSRPLAGPGAGTLMSAPGGSTGPLSPRLQSLAGSVLPMRYAAPSLHRPLAGICSCGGGGGR